MKAINNIDIDFEKNFTTAHGTEVAGRITVANIGGVWKYLACTQVDSNSFKTLKGAERFMAVRGFKTI